ncbi:MAG: leucine-rich repeat protein [Bacteroidaceae bacterium]|nr:leucine-rich repeat protein [Bacteroidaceae bacterium]
MKKFSFLLSVLAALGLYSCTEEAFVEGTASKGLTAQIPAYQFESDTRVGISQNLSTYTWSDGDQIGMYYQDAFSKASAEFTILSGGSSSGVFANSAFSLKPNSTYYAFYPYDSHATVEAYPVDFTGQEQTAKGSTAHIGARNYMSAAVNTDANGAASIAFQNLAAVLQIEIPIEETGIYTDVTLATTGTDFITRGTLDMKTGAITAKAKSQQMELSLGTGIALNKGDVFTANILVAPTDLNGKELTVTLASKYGEDLMTIVPGKPVQAGKAYKLEGGSMEEIPYLTFTAEAEQTLTMSKAVETLEYSVNNGEWQELGTNTVTFGGANGNLRLRGKNNKGTAKNASDYSRIAFGNTTGVACSGDIRTLLDYENYKNVSTRNARFCSLFEYCHALTSAPELPASTLADRCYQSMFYRCSSLASAPELPATTLAANCYSSMFSGCSSFTNAPELSATTLDVNCYGGMFSDCSSLKSAPTLPVTTLTYGCYSGMFSGCTSLTSAPRLPATTLAANCYSSMFLGCTSLVTAPELPATILTDYCYHSMFSNCTSLTTAPELPATTMADRCYQSMFSGCSSLVIAPGLPATTLADYCYFVMFSDCTSLTTAPELPAATLDIGCYFNMFYGCKNLNYIKMLATDISAYDCLFYWTCGVSSTGTFIKSKDATWDVRGESGIPNGWTVQTDAPAVPFDKNGYGGTADGTGYNNNSISNGNGITW